MKSKIQSITKDNIDAVVAVEKLCFGQELSETIDTFEKVLALYPVGNQLILCDGVVAGFATFHPIVKDNIPHLNQVASQFSGNEDNMFVRSMAIHPDFRGQGLAKMLLEVVNRATCAEKLKIQSLISVQGSRTFWEKCGFDVVKAMSYGGASAFYMKKLV